MALLGEVADRLLDRRPVFLLLGAELVRRGRLRSGQQVDHLEERVARGERHVLGLIGERAELVAVEPRLRGDHRVLPLDRHSFGGDEVVRREIPEHAVNPQLGESWRQRVCEQFGAQS